MTSQVRNIYHTHDQQLNRILQDIANRLDIIEGLRPDLDTGYYRLGSEKDIATTDLADDYQGLVSGVTITDNTILVNTGSIEVTNGIIKLTIGADNGAIEVYDADGNLIHKLE